MKKKAACNLTLRGRLPQSPYGLFSRWFGQAQAKAHPGWLDPAAMVLTTVSAGGQPSARVVLCRAHSPRGVVFFTSYRSRKAAEIEATGRGAAVFHWPHLAVQVRLEGRFERVSEAASDRYFASRPRSHQIGAWVSRQSRVLKAREELVCRRREFEARFAGGPVPRPPGWGGYCLMPATVEFWQAGAGRLHERLRYRRRGRRWTVDRLNP